MPKSATMENRHNLEHQFYATVQRNGDDVIAFKTAS